VQIIFEKSKKPGVHYAISPDGIELPVVDVTHPAFALTVSHSEQQTLTQEFVRRGVPLAGVPKALRRGLLQFLLRKSILAKGIRQSEGGFMTGMHTYLLKLGPEMLGSAYSTPVDRKIAAALPVLGVRLRMQDMAYLMADILQPALVTDATRPLRFINIAGGPAIDTLNTLILLSKRDGALISSREVNIEVLDLEDGGPAFGQAALESLCAPNAPLRGLNIGFRHVHYDWSNTTPLKERLEAAHGQGAFILCSSEGGLFEYGSDTDIEMNLKVLRPYSEVLGVVGSVTRADEPVELLRQSSTAAIKPRGLEVFTRLAVTAGWKVARVVERPFSDQVLLV
jgi:hypothetical protein